MSQPILIATLMRPQGDTGVQSHFCAFLSWLKNHKFDATLVTPFDSPRWQIYPMFGLKRLIEPFSKTLSVWWYRYWHAAFLQRPLRSALADGHPCTIYAQCTLSAEAALRARKNPAQRVVMVVHFNISQADEWVGKGMIPEGGRLYTSIRAKEAEVLPRLDGLVFVSEFMRSEISLRIPSIRKTPVRIVPNFLADPAVARTKAQQRADLICIGTLEPRKNQRHALAIVAASVRLGRPLSLTVVGDGPDRAMLQSLASELGINEHVTFVGFVSNAASLMPNHQAFLHVALMESFGIVLIEAMAHGLPVFAPAVGGIPEVFTDGQHGRFISLEDVDAAARTIVKWLDSAQTMDSARQATRCHFLARFEANQVASDLAAFLLQPHMHVTGQLGAAKEGA